ncbi:MGMT family protein [Hugenholtzia roseola]|uniref:MGMT family protein n=1 Tax=Hugenholtzia roseola TaxID=1002 RepID=UPI0003F72B74|nr:MGMT family protein [Hugenholtzia roseola]
MQAEDVFALVRLIPAGRVTTYGAIATYLGGVARGARMVGWFLNQSFSQTEDPVPAHRVVNRLGRLTGKTHFPTPTLMQELLEKEGIKVEDDAIVDFEKHLWLPEKELL